MSSRGRISLGFLVHGHTGPTGAHLVITEGPVEKKGRGGGGFHIPFCDGNLGKEKKARGMWPWFVELVGQAS